MYSVSNKSDEIAKETVNLFFSPFSNLAHVSLGRIPINFHQILIQFLSIWIKCNQTEQKNKLSIWISPLFNFKQLNKTFGRSKSIFDAGGDDLHFHKPLHPLLCCHIPPNRCHLHSHLCCYLCCHAGCHPRCHLCCYLCYNLRCYPFHIPSNDQMMTQVYISPTSSPPRSLDMPGPGISNRQELL